MPVPSSLLDQDGNIPEYQMVFVENQGDTDVTFKWNKARYNIPPGQRIPVPWPAMVRHMGDPRTIDLPGNDPRAKQRTYEFQRLANKYGIYSKHHLWNEKIPKVKAFTLAGEPIITVLDDPRGVSNTDEALTAEASIQNEQTMRAMQQQIAQLTAQLAQLSGGDPSTMATVIPQMADEGTATSADTTELVDTDPSTDSATADDEDDALMDSPIKKVTN